MAAMATTPSPAATVTTPSLRRGNDKIDGGLGSDTLAGGSGIDFFYISEGFDSNAGGSGKDLMDFRALGGGVSLNWAAGTYSLLLTEEDGTFSEIEQVVMSNGADTVIGSAKRDVINMAKGNDTADGGGGIDFITGGEGKDTLTGGAAADTFDYNAIIESQVNVNFRDTITDFLFNVDKIDLSTIDASAAAGGNQAFAFRRRGRLHGGRPDPRVPIRREHGGRGQHDGRGGRRDAHRAGQRHRDESRPRGFHRLTGQAIPGGG